MAFAENQIHRISGLPGAISRGKQHQQSTGTDDPATAFGFRQQFLEKSKEEVEVIKAQSAEIGKWPLKRVAAEYFNWKMANSSAATVAREKRIFKPVEKFFASDFRLNAITLAHLREYQKQRRKTCQCYHASAGNR